MTTRRFETMPQVVARLDRAVAEMRGRLFDVLRVGYRPGTPIYYTADGTFDKADYPGLRAVIVECQGGGGGGGGSDATAATTVGPGGGGGGGEYVRSLVLASDLDVSEAVTVGAGGLTPGAGAGSAGGNSIFDTISGQVLATGGGGGGAASIAVPTAAFANRGAGGTGGTGDLLIAGSDGTNGFATATNRVHPGGGGSSHLGGGKWMTVVSTTTAGINGQLYGGGGTGAGNGISQGAVGAGDGAPGIVIVTPLY